MTLNEFVAQRKRALYDVLRQGGKPEEGRYDEALLAEARTKGLPQMGATRYAPYELVFEFIYQDPHSSALVLPIAVDPPERVVFLPVPGWVVETIWQGEIDGSYHFESHAMAQIEAFRALTSVDANLPFFGPRDAKRRE